MTDLVAAAVEPTIVTVTTDDLRAGRDGLRVTLASDSLGSPTTATLPGASGEAPDRVVLEVPGSEPRIWERQVGTYYRRVRDRADWGCVLTQKP